MADLDAKLLRAFLAIDAARGVTAAAARQGVSQPTMSGHLRRLRAHFQDPLFVFRHGALQPTAEADAVRPVIAAVAEGLTVLGAAGQPWSPARSSRRFRLMASGYVQELLLPALDVRLRQAGPELGLEVVPVRPGDPWDACDARIGPREAVPEGCRMRTLFEERLVCLLDPALRPACGTLDLDAFCSLEHLLVAPAPSPPHDAVDRALGGMRRARRVARVVPDANGLAPLLFGVRRLAMLPARSAARLRDALWAAEPPVALPSVSFVLSWPATADDAGHAWFRGLVADVARPLRTQAAALPQG